MTPAFTDTHCHLDDPGFDADRLQVLERALAAGVNRLIAVGTDFASSRKALRLAEEHPAVFAAVGWHPGHAAEAPLDLRAELRELAHHPRVVAIGETGLDYFRLPSGKTEACEAEREAIRQRQRSLFHQHLEVAADLGLNCVIHQRSSFEDTLRVLEPFAHRVRGVFHCFANPVAELQRVLALGSLVSFTGLITFPTADLVRESVAAVPPDRFMVETDAPYLAPIPVRGQRCEPAHTRLTAEAIAQIRRCSLETLSQQTNATAETFFPGLRP